MWFSHAVGYYTVMKRKTLLCSRAWKSIRQMMLREELHRGAHAVLVHIQEAQGEEMPSLR